MEEEGSFMRSSARLCTYYFFLILFFVTTAVPPALCDTNPAKVLAVKDGDTISVVETGGRQMEVRLEGIDAPEHGQPFAEASKEHLGSLVLGKDVVLDCTALDEYSRMVCKVLLPGGEDADLEQIKAGLAWHYKQFQRLQSATDRANYGAAEDAARRARLGLWADAQPLQPQDFRHGTRSGICLDDSDHRIACSDTYVGPVRANRRSGIYHWPGCPNYGDIAEHNRIEYPNAVAAEQAGYRAARNCP
jgi:endonuclease YncB( thermonuclease family)